MIDKKPMELVAAQAGRVVRVMPVSLEPSSSLVEATQSLSGGTDPEGAGRVFNDTDYPVSGSQAGGEGSVDPGSPVHSNQTVVVADPENSFAIHIDAIDKIHTTAESHHRIMVIEVMGRDAGWIAPEAGIAGGAHVILIPEIAFDIRNVCQFVINREATGKKFTIVVVAEGIGMPPDLETYHGKERRTSARSGSMGNLIGDAIGNITKREVRVTVLGHIQRGGSPTAFDRVLATRYGLGAIDMVHRGEFGRMAALRGNKILSVPLAEATGTNRTVDQEMLDAAFGILEDVEKEAVAG